MQRGFSYQQLVLRDSQRGGKLKFVCCGKASRLFVQFYLPTPENTDNCGKTLHMNMPKLAKKWQETILAGGGVWQQRVTDCS